MSSPEIMIVDYGMGNKRSIQLGIEKAGGKAVISGDPETLLTADGLILPGVGAFPTAMMNIREKELLEPINAYRRLGKPILGICLGMQLMFTRSFEHDETEGLGFIPGEVRSLKPKGGKLPVVGWVNVNQRRESALFNGIEDGTPFYHMHSYACRPEEDETVLAVSACKGGYVSAVQSENVYGMQFHPEKSSKHPGLVACRNFVTICQNQI